MREIEVKARVHDKEKLLGALKNNNIVLSKPITQRDQVYGLPGEDGGDGNSLPWLRLRTETKDGQTRYLFTLKKSLTGQLDSIEHETEVTDAAETLKIIEHMGYAPYSDLTKTRAKAQIRDVELCVDTVSDLGDFIEAEKLTSEDANYEKVAEELWQILESFGLSRTDQVTDGYDVLQRKLRSTTE